ncbi:MAG: PAS domain-containing protein [Spirochaetaceae bacterium]|nr:PAS domain-containing protein [Spirochaetaceae bacterium]
MIIISYYKVLTAACSRDFNENMDIMDYAALMVDFLGKACGENCEIVLQDLREGRMRITAIANGHISGRALGDPLTPLALRMVTGGVWKKRDYVCGHRGKTRDSRVLRSSTFFIKGEAKLLGMLSINIDISRYISLSGDILALAGLNPEPQKTAPENRKANLIDRADAAIKSVLDEFGIAENKKESFTVEERLAIVERLMDRGVFLIRGSVSGAAEKLRCSEASLYRYIGAVKKRKALKSRERKNSGE